MICYFPHLFFGSFSLWVWLFSIYFKMNYVSGEWWAWFSLFCAFFCLVPCNVFISFIRNCIHLDLKMQRTLKTERIHFVWKQSIFCQFAWMTSTFDFMEWKSFGKNTHLYYGLTERSVFFFLWLCMPSISFLLNINCVHCSSSCVATARFFFPFSILLSYLKPELTFNGIKKFIWH